MTSRTLQRNDRAQRYATAERRIWNLGKSYKIHPSRSVIRTYDRGGTPWSFVFRTKEFQNAIDDGTGLFFSLWVLVFQWTTFVALQNTKRLCCSFVEITQRSTFIVPAWLWPHAQRKVKEDMIGSTQCERHWLVLTGAWPQSHQTLFRWNRNQAFFFPYLTWGTTLLKSTQKH